MTIQNNKIAKICFNGIKFFNADGSRCKKHPFSSRWKNDLNFLKKEGYTIIN